MKFTISKVLEDVSIAFGVVLGVNQIETILGIVLLVFQIGLIIFKCVRSIVEHVKKKDLDGIEKDLEDASKQIEDLSDKKKDGK